MKLSVVLYTSKTLADETHPIMLRLHYKKKFYYKSLGISCKPTEWNKNDCICRKSFHRYVSFNKIIKDERNKVQDKIDLFLANKNKKSFTIEDIFVAEGASKKLIEVIEEHKSQYTKFNTTQKYSKLINRLKEFGYENLYIEHIDATFLKTFYNRIKEGKKDTTIYTYMAVFDASLETAVQKKYITENPFIHTDFKYDRKTPKRALSRFDIDKLIVYYKNNFLLPHPLNIHSKAPFSLSKINSVYYTLNLFLSSYYLQGLSLIDLAKLKVKDVKFSHKIIGENNNDFIEHHEKEQSYDFMINALKEMINDNPDIEERNKIMTNYEGLLEHLNKNGKNSIIQSIPKQKILSINLKRSKTNKDVPIVQEYKGMLSILLEPNLSGKEPDDYLFNIFNSKCDDEKYKIGRLTYVTNMCNKNLEKLRTELGLNIDKITTYSARHTYASVLYHNNVSSSLIAQNLGRDIRDIDVYLKEFDDDKIIESNKVLD